MIMGFSDREFNLVWTLIFTLGLSAIDLGLFADYGEHLIDLIDSTSKFIQFLKDWSGLV